MNGNEVGDKLIQVKYCKNMVVFTCNNCGETMQKPKVAKHYEFRCRTAPFVSCVDCFKDFRGEEYVSHTKCITEAERYGGKDYVPKPGANKGERKQQEWINIVNNILNSETHLTNLERNFLNHLSKFDNIPRKKTKFLNFIRNIMGNKTNPAVVDSVWNKMETAYKSNMQNTTTKQENGKVIGKQDDKKCEDTNQENNVIENQNNENIYKENQGDDEQNKNNGLHDAENNDTTNIKQKKSKKSKKRKMSETMQEQLEEPVPKKTKNGVTQKSVPSEENKNILCSESPSTQCDNATENSTFSWKNTILHIVKSKEEISLKKLQKKVISQYMKFCSNSVTQEKACSKFNKKLKKVSEVVISDEKVRLA